MKKISVLLLASSIGLAAHSQTVIDPLTGSLAGYTTYQILDNSLGGGSGVSFSTSGSGLQANFSGATSDAEQALLLAPASSFSTTFGVGSTLSVLTTIPVSSTTEDLGLAIASGSPVSASAGNSWSSRTSFDFASISVRPSQTAIRQNTSISGTLTTSAGILAGVAANTVDGLYITWVSSGSGGNVFALGYYNSSDVAVQDDTVTFASGSTIGTDIGIYGDIRTTGTDLGELTDLTIQPVPEPSALALCGVGLGGAVALARRKKLMS